MAQYPCDRHGARYSGPQRTAYPAILGTEALTRREKFRLCKPCFAELEEYLAEHFYDAADNTAITACLSCSGPDTSIAVFCTLYDHKADRVDWYGRVCESCAAGPVLVSLFSRQTELPLALFGLQGGKSPA